VASFQSQIRRSQKWSALATAKETPNCRETAGLHLTFFPNAAHLDLSAFSRISPLFGEGVFGALSKVRCTPLNLWFRWTKKGGSLVRENKRESSLAYIFSPHHFEFFPISRTKGSPNMATLRYQEGPSSFRVTTRISNVVGVGSSSSFGAPMSISDVHHIGLLPRAQPQCPPPTWVAQPCH
jgi:hypothetical protein